MFNRLRKKVMLFIESKREVPALAAFAAGLYPLIYYYNSNFTLVNSWSQFLFFITFYILIPILGFIVIYFVFRKRKVLKAISKYVIPVLNLGLFAFLIVISTYGFDLLILSISIVVAILVAILSVKHFKKIIVFQLLLSILVFPKLIPDFYRHLTYSSIWMDQADNITQVQFKKRPNVYIIQPDGYANFSELNKGFYNFDNSDFETFLEENNFKTYDNFRSNYFTTLSSNSSMFGMRHHYYHKPKLGLSELYNSRDIIVGENPVVKIFKTNNYKTHLILEGSYLLVNRPKIYYDYCNISLKEIPYLSRGFEEKKDVLQDLENAIDNNQTTNNFYFVEKIIPGHVATYKNKSDGKTQERIDYLDNIKKANTWLKDVVNMINEKDKNSLIVIVSDHGGYVGFDYTLESKSKQTDRDLVYSIFTSALAIKWPEDSVSYEDQLRSNVNLFRILFSYLGSNDAYLENLEPDNSYSVIQTGAPFGVYENIDQNGNVVFKMLSE